MQLCSWSIICTKSTKRVFWRLCTKSRKSSCFLDLFPSCKKRHVLVNGVIHAHVTLLTCHATGYWFLKRILFGCACHMQQPEQKRSRFLAATQYRRKQSELKLHWNWMSVLAQACFAPLPHHTPPTMRTQECFPRICQTSAWPSDLLLQACIAKYTTLDEQNASIITKENIKHVNECNSNATETWRVGKDLSSSFASFDTPGFVPLPTSFLLSVSWAVLTVCE